MISSDWFFLGWALAMVFALLWLDAREAARRARRAAHEYRALAVAKAKARRLANRRAEGVAR